MSFDLAPLRRRVLDAWAASPARFREDANSEADAATSPSLLVELAQNAYDAALRAGVPGSLLVEVVDGVLYAANTGAPLDEDGVEAAERWYDGDAGPDVPHARQAPAPCVSCGFFVPFAGALGFGFGGCANEFSPDDGRVVAVDHGCGAHSEGSALVAEIGPAPALIDEFTFEVVDDDGVAAAADDDGADAATDSDGSADYAMSESPAADADEPADLAVQHAAGDEPAPA